MDQSKIRNFCIIAHIDHGKSTLADRFLEHTGTVDKRAMRAQLLDDMDLERERGITIKAHAVSMFYKRGKEEYLLNLIDTPGHVDFSYEVLKSLQACEGAILLVDAAQGVEAQTVANTHLAVEQDLEVIPTLNKIDLPHARPEEIAEEIENSLCYEAELVQAVSAKTGQGVAELLDAVIERVPAPNGERDAPLRALIFDSEYDDYRGVIVYVRIVDGTMKKGEKIRMLRTGTTYEVLECGIFNPTMKPKSELNAGEVGYLISNIKRLQDVKVGDTVAPDKAKDLKPLPGYKEPKPMVFCGIYPTNPGDYDDLRSALQTLSLNDASFTYEPESSEALGFGFRCGFLGLLHMEIVQERLEREEDMDIVQTAPTVTYEVVLTNGVTKYLHSPSEMPEPNHIEELREPYVQLNMLIPKESIGAIMKMCTERRGIYVKTEYLSSIRVYLHYEIPLSEIIFDFFDRLKSATRGFGTMDYELLGYRKGDLVKLRIMVQSNEVDALSTIVHRDKAEIFGRKVIQKLRKEIPRHMFQVALQAAIGGKIVARENIRALSKNVTAKCYGGDITRKRKLWEKQKEGKKRMKAVGNVEIPQKAFLAVLGTDED
ncbi:MAG: elongation factor 4 [Planctomycetes bacterium]|nr:elongation factor 4 [Planctomycetota bacterium]MCB9890891.1 elongation factor 4 [Planctomycetota bacterium]